MSRVRVAAFSISIDGFGAGPRQDLQNPLGVRGTEVHDWLFHTEVFKKMQGQGGWPSLRPRLPVATTTEGGPSLRLRSGQALAHFARAGNDAADTRPLPCDASVLGSPLRKLREGRGTHGVDASESGSVPCCRSKISKGSQNPHPNVAKGATLGWGTRLFALLPKFGEGLFPVNRLHSAALEIIVTAI